ncbi:type I polyketide synthase [Streptomyces olivochromogenes]|uniref:type I polyketide synthase n=1 Tax=Streptomyces olivochromogenes TaxID=1963 RepID=UPI001F282CF8|nr:type I polyketide synthase [Streptomyces olivochromogenes]MCF3131980.1 acyltransferase domain-containing protein [Streptomyces olivochromogenes]
MAYGDGVAIVGIDCAFPLARDTDAYWELLLRGGDAIGDVPTERWDPAAFPAADGAARAGLARGGFLDGADVFDNDFFSVPPREAAAMDPQQRLLLHSAWRAVEDSGVAPGSLAGSGTGVYVGVMGGEWGRLHLGDYDRVTPQLGAGSSAGMTANRISYQLGFTGPSMAVDTACSSSLVAVHLGVGALLSGECDTVLAGGVNLVMSPALGLVYHQLGLAAADGRCKPFSALADGIGRSEGVGLVVLRRLSDAVADGQRIYAVIRGTAVNQDGRSNGITAPNRWSQEQVVATACKRAGVEPREVTFVEAHGTGTALGDTIECAALGSLHGEGRAEPCAIGSVKGNLGHTEGAAGIAGLIKVALALHHRIVPASRFADRENPQLRLAQRGLRLLKSPLRLPPGPVVAGLSSFGMGGTNAHAVLGSAPRPAPRTTAKRARPGAGVFTLTADTPGALIRNLTEQADAVARRPRTAAAALCRQSNRVKTGLPYRFAVTARDTEELAGALREAAAGGLPEQVAHRPWSRPSVAFLFTGQGAQYAGMTAGLYRESAAYRQHLDAADAALLPYVDTSVRDLLLAGDERGVAGDLTQPALFAVAYALAATLTAFGIRPAAVLGHSVGEFAAAVTAGVLTLDEAAHLVAARGRLMHGLPEGGAMLSVQAGPDALRQLLAEEPQAHIAALNGPRDTVLSGTAEALARIAETLEEAQVRARDLQAPAAFHSPLVRPVLDRLRSAAGSTEPRTPEIPVFSTRYGRLLADTERMDADYWAAQAESPVLFADALADLETVCAPTHLVEIGPRPQLLPLAGRAGLATSVEFLHPAPGPEAGGSELAELVAQLYRTGLDPDWERLYDPEVTAGSGEKLRGYSFSTAHRYWTAPPAPRTEQVPAARPAATPPRPTSPLAEPAEPATTDPVSRDRDPVLAAVIDAVAEVGSYPLEQVVHSARFYEDLGFDSVMIMQLKDRIEARLPHLGEVSVQQLLPALRSVGTLAQFLGGHLTEGVRA